MKKYLITGALALVVSATMISCHSDDDFGGSIIEQKIQAYQEVFEQEFGTIDPNQDWGFGSAELLARTRAGMAQVRTRGSQPDANKWADDGYMAPRELSEGQKIRVMAYFQANPYLTYVDPHYENFFVQQVYKGYTTPGAISAEVYQPTDTNNDPVVGSDHMDHLTFGIKSDGTAKDHDFNFNHGRFSDENSADPNGTPRNNVQNWPGVTYLNDNGDGTHQDHIMLMLGSSTECVGFQDSNGSLVHLDCCANAGADVIDAWALAHEDSLRRIGKFGETVTDEWERSFVGLDYEQQTINELYAGYTAKALDFIDGNSQYILYHGQVYPRDGFADFDLKDPGNNAVQYIKDDVSNMGLAEYIKYTKTDGTVGNVTKDAYNYKLTQDQYKTLYKVDIPNGEAGLYNLDMILGYIYESALPTQNNGNWVKNIGGRDYVFSDWIVTLTKGMRQGDPNTIPITIEPGSQGSDKTKDMYYVKRSFDPAGSGRVFCEDLGVVRASDIDFNDIVFDVCIYQTEYITEHMISKDNGTTWVLDTENYGTNAREITSTTYDGDVWLLAGGGTIPVTIRIGGDNGPNYNLKDVFDQAWGQEPKITDKYIVNTIKDEEGSYGNLHRSIDKAVKLNDSPLAITSVADVHINVQYGNQFYELVAYKGVAPHKIRVPLDTQWLLEREEINHGYPNFTKYVKYQDENGNLLTNYKNNPGVTQNDGPEGGYVGDGDDYEFDEHANSVWNNYNVSSLYVLPSNFEYTRRHQESGWSEDEVFIREEIKSNGSSSSGYQNGDPVLIRRRH